MRVIRSVAEIAELWTCPGFVPAFHFAFGYDYAAQEAKFQKILATGTLLPAALIGTQNMFLLDVMAEDDSYVFLSPARPPRGMGGSSFGFVFDANKLVQNGAVVGKDDLLEDYEREAVKTLKKYYGPNTSYEIGGDILRRRNTEDTNNQLKRAITYANQYVENPLTLDEFWRVIKDALTAYALDPRHRSTGDHAQKMLDNFANELCGRMRGLLAKGAEKIRTSAADFREWSESYVRQGRDWTATEICRRAIRDTMASDPNFDKLSMGDVPELLWPGELPVDTAVAFIALDPPEKGLLYRSAHFPDDLFKLLCDETPSTLGRASRRSSYRPRLIDQPASEDALRARRFMT